MPNITSAKKRVRQSETKRVHNKHIRSGMRTHVKEVVYAIDAGDKAKASEAYKLAVASIDSSVAKGILHKNKGARQKSRMNSRIVAMS
ncbi:MAG: 30S ribosomal protein S20 [Cocleimonas sp.]